MFYDGGSTWILKTTNIACKLNGLVLGKINLESNI